MKRKQNTADDSDDEDEKTNMRIVSFYMLSCFLIVAIFIYSFIFAKKHDASILNEEDF
jgi:hypothetical protein